jgi:triphosphoribosyl-dephospho-CoA synthase
MSSSVPRPDRLSIGQCATLACLLEATAPKVGNVHRAADFPDLTFTDFAVSSVLIGPAMEAAATAGIGRAVLEAVAATRDKVDTNTNLGMILLLAPLAVVPRDQPLVGGVAQVLARLSAEDCRLVYEAIRLAQPGGLGQVDQMDVHGPPPDDLLAAMRLAADRDLVARQYADGFQLVLHETAPRLARYSRHRGWTLTDAIIRVHLELLSQHADSLIARKCGREMAERVSRLAEQVLDAGAAGDEAYDAALADLDFFLRSDGNKRNPGTTADLIAAGLFAALRDGLILPPYK